MDQTLDEPEANILAQWEKDVEEVRHVAKETVTLHHQTCSEINECFKQLDKYKKRVTSSNNNLNMNMKRFGEEHAETEMQCLAAEKQVQEKKTLHEELTNTLASVTSELKLVTKAHDEQLRLCEETKRQGELSDTDRKMLSEAKLKLDLYKQLTNVKFDYTIPETEAARGYIRNKERAYCRPFEFKCDEREPSEVTEELWQRVYAAAHDWLANSNKENISENK